MAGRTPPGTGISVTPSRPRPLRDTDQRRGFACGDDELDGWLQRIAPMAQAGRTARVYVCIDGDRVVGFYALAAGHVARADLDERAGRGAPSPVPVAVLARLAVDRGHQGQGLGLALVSDATRRVVDAADILGIRALIVHAADERAVSFYEAAGFVPSPSDPQHLAILVKDLRGRYGPAE